MFARTGDDGGYRWADEYNPNDLPVEYGYLTPRYTGSVVAAHIDGHVDLLKARQMQDMRRWANQADSPDWALEPR